jgi:hypothetical protein
MWCTRERGAGRLNVAQSKGTIRCGRLVVTERVVGGGEGGKGS